MDGRYGRRWQLSEESRSEQDVNLKVPWLFGKQTRVRGVAQLHYSFRSSNFREAVGSEERRRVCAR